MSRRPGGYIGAKPTWTTVSTSGVFSLRDVTKLKADGQWPRGPEAPTGLTATPGLQQVSLSWAPPVVTHGSITDYRIELSTDGGVTWAAVSDGIGTTTSLTVSSLAGDTTYTFRVAAVNHTAGDWSDTASATTTSTPPQITITSQPSNQTASGGAATFSIAATVTEGASLSYQWQKQESGVGEFAAVSGATSASLALSGLTNAADNGDVYRCVVSATGGATSVTSNSATLTVPVEYPQFINVSGHTGAGDVNGSYLLEATLTNGRPSYQRGAGTRIYWNGWPDYWAIVGLVNGSSVLVRSNGANAALPPTSGWSANHGGGTLAVDFPSVGISQQPTPQTTTNGAASFTVAALSSTVSPTYQWQRQESGVGEFSNISGATDATLSLSGLTYSADNGDVYRCVVSESSNGTSATSNAASLTVVPQFIYVSGHSGAGDLNGTYELEATLTADRPAYRRDATTRVYYLSWPGYWRFDNSGSRVATHSTSPALPPTGGWVLDMGSGTLAVSYTPPTPVITITSQPTNQTASGGAATFSVSATVTENATLSYQWQKQESGAGAFSAVSGATSSSLALSGLTNADDNGDVYRCVVSATGGATSVTSSSATLTVSVEYPAILTVSGHITGGSANGTYLLESSLTNGKPSYRKDANTSIYWNSGLTRWDLSGYFSGTGDVRVLFLKSGDVSLPPTSGWSNNFGDGTLVVAYPSVAITQQPTNQTALGGAATFSAAAIAATGSPTFQWQKQEGGSGSFTNVSGATSSSLALSGLTSGDDNGDVYRVVVSEAATGTFTTSNAVSLVVPPQFVYVSGHTGSGNANGTYLLESAFTNGKPSYRKDADTSIWWNTSSTFGWSLSGYFSGTGNVPILFFKPGDVPLPPTSGWTNNFGSGTLAISYTPPPPVITITSQPTNQTASSGAATFSVTATVTENATLSYQWQKQESGAGSFTNVSGATSSSLALSGLTNADDNGDVYRCVVSATGGATSVTSSSATLTVAASSGPPAPTNLTAAAGDTSVALDWTAPANTTGITDYVIQYSTDGGTTWITYIPAPIITITQQPTAQVASGGAATFSVSATATEGGTLSYQWQKQESGTGAFTNVSGATSSSLSLTGLVYADDHSDKYRCVISALVAETNATSSKTSTAATLLIENPAGPPTPVLLATFDGNALLDAGPNNYWLESSLDGYPDYGSVKRAYELAWNYRPYASGGSLEVGYVWGSSSLGVRTDVGRANFASQVNNGPFTVEMWYYPGDALSAIQGYYSGERYFRIGPYLVAGIKADANNASYNAPTYAYTAVYGGYGSPGSELCLTTTLLTPQTWNHVALVYDGSNVRLYINGTLACTGPASGNSWINEFQVGGFYGNEFASNAYSRVDDIRVTAAAIYTGDDIIVPAIGSLTYSRSTNATTELLLNATHGIEDWGKNKIMLEYTGYFNAPARSTYAPIVSTDQSKYGGASYYMDGTVSGLHLVDPTYWSGQTAAVAPLTSTLQNGPWTLEMWVRPTATLSYNSTPIGDPDASGEAYWTLAFAENEYIALYDNTYAGPKKGTFVDGEGNEYPNSWLVPDTISPGVTLEYRVGGVSQRINLPTSLSRNAWHHLAVVADTANGLLRLKVDGAEIGTIDISGSWSSKGTLWPGIDGLAIGELNNHIAGYSNAANTYNWFTGYIDEIRISSAALYGTGSYSVPTAALT